jgi:anti-sigma factor ChrR (cupin superfamily)
MIDFRSSQALLDRATNNGEKTAPSPGTHDSLAAALVRTDDLDWINDGVGNQIKILRISEETSFCHLVIKAKAGQVNPPHTHLGPADFYVIQGSFDYRGGSARAGDWVYEPTGAVHEATTRPTGTICLTNIIWADSLPRYGWKHREYFRLVLHREVCRRCS